MRDLSESLKIELVNYGYGDKDIKTAISLLDKKYTEYVSLKNERDYYARHAEEVKQQIDVEEKFFTEFFATYKIDGDKNELLENMRSDRFVVDNLKTKLKKLNDEISEFDGIPEAISVENDASVTELATRYNEANKRLAKINADITANENILEDYPDAVSLSETISEDLAAAEEKYALLYTTFDFLSKAEKTIKDEYIAPVLCEFKEYISNISQEFSENADMDKDFCVKFERNGELRSDKYFSVGQRAVIATCLRFALTDKIFKSEKPFIVFDDPFWGLDEEHLANIIPVLNKLSNDKQIIYFTCHPSRKI